MTLIPKSEVRKVYDLKLGKKEIDEENRLNGLTGDKLENEKMNIYICKFLQGAVYCWCKNRKDEWFSMRDLMGGDNFYWQETPLMALFEKHKALGKNDDAANKEAGKESGWLLKHVIDKDKRNFETKKEELIRKYRWDGKGM